MSFEMTMMKHRHCLRGENEDVRESRGNVNRARNVKYLLAGAVALATFLVYLPALWNGFVEWDDGPYVVENNHIRSFDAALFKWAFFNFYASNWHPLTWISHALDYAFWGLNPLGHHLTNNILHASNTFLVVLLVMKLLQARANGLNGLSGLNKGPLIAAGTTGLLFGLHPLHVESVAWVAERKDLLCALFFLLSIMAYTKAVTRMEQGAERIGSTPCAKRFEFFTNKQYLLALGFFILALLSKPMAVTLPVVLLILDWHPFNRISSLKAIRPVFVEKLPFMALACASSIVTVMAQKTGGALSAMDALPLSTRLPVGAESLDAYLGKMLWPLNLVPYYPYPKDASFASFNYLAAAVLIVGITWACVLMVKKQKMWLSAWGYYVVTLVPVLGIVQVGSQSMADRYTYLPGLGPFLIMGVAAAWTAGSVLAVKKPGPFVKGSSITAAALGVVFLSYLTVAQISIWKDSFSLWNYVVEQEPEAVPSAYNGRALAFETRGLYSEALSDYDKAIALHPAYAEAYINRGSLFVRLNQVDKAIADYNKALVLNPSRYEAYYNLGLLYGRTGFSDRAIEYFSKSIDTNPQFAAAYKNRGLSHFYAGHYDSALKDFDTAIALDQNSASVYLHRGNLYLKAGKITFAMIDFQKACDLGEKSGCSAMQQ